MINIKVRLREHEYKLLKECFDEIAPDLNFRLDAIDNEGVNKKGDACEADSNHVCRCETTIERWSELMNYCTSLEREIFDENDKPRYPENSPEYKRYEKFDRLWSIMFYIGDLYGIA